MSLGKTMKFKLLLMVRSAPCILARCHWFVILASNQCGLAISALHCSTDEYTYEQWYRVVKIALSTFFCVKAAQGCVPAPLKVWKEWKEICVRVHTTGAGLHKKKKPLWTTEPPVSLLERAEGFYSDVPLDERYCIILHYICYISPPD